MLPPMIEPRHRWIFPDPLRITPEFRAAARDRGIGTFAATVLATLDALSDESYCRDRLGLSNALGGIDRSRLNVNGSSLAAGHPFAATGGRIVPTLAKLLHQRGTVDGRTARGIVSICAAGGQGAVAILEAC